MDRNKIYEKKARLYPVIISMIIPFVLIFELSRHFVSTLSDLENYWNALISIIPAGLVTGALTYGVKLLARSTSKALFQFPLFKEDETNMPTTNFILWSDKNISRQNKQLIHYKIKTDLGLKIYSESEEINDEREARLTIADAVMRIREKTRDNLILFNYNCNFGFIRNFLGANIWSFFIVVIIGLINSNFDLINWKLLSISFFLILISFPISYWILKQVGKEYARQLFTAYLEL